MITGFESLIVQFGALGIVAYVVYDQKRVTNKLIQEVTQALYSVNYSLNSFQNVILKCQK